MRKTVIYNTGETIRFRCWNRKGYAIFRSLHRHVTIGHVCKSIADSALKKDKSTLNLENRRGGVDFRMQTEEKALINLHMQVMPELRVLLMHFTTFMVLKLITL